MKVMKITNEKNTVTMDKNILKTKKLKQNIKQIKRETSKRDRLKVKYNIK